MKKQSFKIQNLLDAKQIFYLKNFLTVVAVATSLALKEYFDWSFVEALIFVYFLTSLLWRWPSRIAALGALLLLVFCAIFLISGKESWADSAAVYAFYLLIITAIGQFEESTFKKKRAVDNSLDATRVK